MESSGYIDLGLIPRAVMGLLALLLGNAFIVGINQIYDVRLDKINKPFLPLASGEMKQSVAWGIVVSSGLLGLAIVRAFFSRLIFGLYAFGMSFGALYSVPPFRFKRYPPLAAITISCVRGFLMNFGVYHATKSALGVPFAWSPPITFLAAFMTVFACVIAVSKDLPDIKGDEIEGIPTFASKMGPERMVKFVVALLLMNYGGAIVTGLFAPPGAFRRYVLLFGHVALASWLLRYRRNIDPSNHTSIKAFYAFIWKLFYAEYLLFPFI
ncbi:Homogentisate solanesyltransferase, chloroplastic [Gracilariopsis chorda]|uniref:Homogentisate solanesyltransferase, chloroplastic n=1 Tax=Gracilariopsis chorda TaxID=448386 RepID=A0A2V3IXB1_9FLOR|nr:Homogentisate solanesyltransferase, chloroplastic [Gracilariopsis chorda]|eukprot:PXF46739.1 Homogentisate solanesyltransferase, chloroplastic [Gracilariopsis chorda]